ncbi:MAG: radical SAM protein [Candidatus Omnitrophica bacterium]|nr:radical SAM protein [Candidatus Omnitrophota bacterium]
MLSVKDMARIACYAFKPDIVTGGYVKLEVSANCNARCAWCWMFNSDTKPHGLIKVEDVEKFVALNRAHFIAHKTGIMPFFNGECLIHPRIFDILDIIVASGIRLKDIDTNLGMKIDIPKLLSYPFKHIRVNIGGLTKEVHERMMGTDFGLVTDNLRKAFNIAPRRMFVKMVVTKDNFAQIGGMDEFMKSLGGLPENKIIADTGFALPAMASDKDIRGFFDSVVSPNIDRYLKFDYDLSKDRYGIKAREKGCHFILNCITYNGKLTICCQDQLGKLDLGNAFQTPLYELISTDEYKNAILKAKSMGFDFCAECN